MHPNLHSRSESYNKENNIDDIAINHAQSMIDNEPIISTCINNIINSFSKSKFILTFPDIVDNVNKKKNNKAVDNHVNTHCDKEINIVTRLLNDKWKLIIADILITSLTKGISPLIIDIDGDGDFIPIIIKDKSYQIKTFFNNVKKKQDFRIYIEPTFADKHVYIHDNYSILPALRYINRYYYDNELNMNNHECDDCNSIELIDQENKNNIHFKIMNYHKEIKDVYFILHNNFEPNTEGEIRSSLYKLSNDVIFFDSLKKSFMRNIKLNSSFNAYITKDIAKSEENEDDIDLNVPSMYQAYNKSVNERKRDEIIQKINSVDELIDVSGNNTSYHNKNNKTNSNSVYNKEFKPPLFNNIVQLHDGYKFNIMEPEKIYESNIIENTYSRLVKTISEVLGVYIKPQAIDSSVINNANMNDGMKIDEMLDKTRTYWSVIIEKCFTDIINYLFGPQGINYFDSKVYVEFVHNKLSMQNQVENIMNAFDNNLISYDQLKIRVLNTIGIESVDVNDGDTKNSKRKLNKISKSNMEEIRLLMELNDKGLVDKEESTKRIRLLMSYDDDDDNDTIANDKHNKKLNDKVEKKVTNNDDDGENNNIDDNISRNKVINDNDNDNGDDDDDVKNNKK